MHALLASRSELLHDGDACLKFQCNGTRSGKNTTRRRTEKEMEWVDKDKNGKVTLQEYLHDTIPDVFGGNETQAEIDTNQIWQDSQYEWLLSSKVCHCGFPLLNIMNSFHCQPDRVSPGVVCMAF